MNTKKVLFVCREKATINEGQCLISKPANLSMRTTDGVKIMGIQITKGNSA